MHITFKLYKKLGFTFIEMLIALTINIVILAALLSIFSSNLRNYTQMNNNDQLNQQLEIAMGIMVSDIRRAGYWSAAKNDINTNQNNNPFMAAATDLTVTGGNCILFTYDHNNTGTLPSISTTSDDDRYGFRLTGGALQTRPPGNNFSCASSATTWENITDPNVVTITNLSFTLGTVSIPVGQAHPSLALRTITISITGTLVDNTTITKTVTQTVRIRNDKFAP